MIKPCPFGAGEPSVKHSNFGYYICVWVPCEMYEYEEVYRTPYFQSESDLLGFWNNRPSDETIDELENEVRNLTFMLQD